MSNFGQLTAIFDTINRAGALTAKTLIESKKLKGEHKLEKLKLFQQERLTGLEYSFKDKELQARMIISARRDKLFKSIALYAGIGIAAIAMIITAGVLFVGAKREDQFEYMEEVEF